MNGRVTHCSLQMLDVTVMAATLLTQRCAAAAAAAAADRYSCTQQLGLYVSQPCVCLPHYNSARYVAHTGEQ